MIARLRQWWHRQRPPAPAPDPQFAERMRRSGAYGLTQARASQHRVRHLRGEANPIADVMFPARRTGERP